MKIRRSKQGVILEQLLHGMKHRYALCWDGGDYAEWGAYDCGCCITYVGGDQPQIFSECGCSCHRLIEEMANGPMMRLFLLAFKASGEMPFIPKDYQDWIDHCRPIKAEHDKWRENGHPSKPEDCCEECKLVLQQEKLYGDHQKDSQNCIGKDCHICRAQAKSKARSAGRKQRNR